MSLIMVLDLTILIGALVSGVQGSESKGAQGGAIGLIVCSLLDMLFTRGTLDSFTGSETIRSSIPVVMAVLALITTFKARERSLSLVLLFAALLHFLLSFEVIDRI